MMPPPDDAPATDLEQEYEILGELGRGGSAIVYHARDRALGRHVAIKVVRPRFAAGDDEALLRLAREARTVAQLEHPNIVRVHAVKRLHDGGLALVMQYVPGRTLKQAILDDGPFAPDRAERVFREVATALAYANSRGVIHRDVKPENVFLDEITGRALLSDFGIAHSAEYESRLTMTGTAIGTPAYMAPEQIDGAAADARSDVYSLGLVAWEMLTGRRPWEGESLYSIIYKQKHEQLSPIDDFNPAVPPRLQYIVERMLQKKPAARWAGADGLLAHLEASVLPADWTQWQEAHRRRKLQREAPKSKAALVVNAAIATIRFQRPPKGAVEHRPPVAAPDGAGDIDDPTPTWVSEVPEAPRRTRYVAVAVMALLLLSGGAYALYATRDLNILAAAQPSAVVRDVGTIELPLGIAPATDTLADSVAALSDTLFGDTTVALATNPAFLPPDGAPVVAAAPVQPRVTPPNGGLARDSVQRPLARRQAIPIVPVTPPTAVASVRATDDRALVAAGGRHTCLINAGRVLCWGGNEQGQVGDGDIESRATPTRVAGDIELVQVAAGVSHSCGITRSGDAFCWGSGEQGQLGDATTTARTAPVRVAGSFTFRSVVAGRAHSCGLTTGGDIVCWGSNASGQLGDGTTTNRSTPVRIATGGVSFISVAAGWTHSCGLTTEGVALCWGDNRAGQLGAGDRVSRRTAAAVSGDVRFTSIAAGSAHTCAVASNGEVYCWGRNSVGQLGAGSGADQDVPQRVETSARFVSVSTGSVHSCARTQSGSVFCWGGNSYGQLGDGSMVDRAQPVRVVGGLSFSTINASGAHTCGVTIDGDAACWGYNIDGQLGDGTRNHRPRPARVVVPQI